MVGEMEEPGEAPETMPNVPPRSPFTTQEEAEQATEQRKALVKEILADVQAWKDHHKDAFKRMKRNVRFVKNAGNEQWKGSSGVSAGDDNYVANVTHRFIQQKVSSLYARDPRVRARRRPTLEHVIWDGRAETLATAVETVKMAQAAMQAAVGGMAMGAGAPPAAAPVAPSAGPPPAGHSGGPPMAAPPPAPMMDPATALLIVKEAIDIRARRDMIDKIGKTAEILFQHTIDTAVPSFKTRMKQAVRRSATTSVAWIKLDFERAYAGFTPATQDKIEDFSSRIRHIQASLGDVQADDVTDGAAQLEELKLSLEAVMKQPDMIAREGLVFDFPKSWDVIPDDECTQLVGLIGCKKLAHQFEGTPASIKRDFNVDITGAYTAYRPDGNRKRKADNKPDKVVWYEVYDSTVGLIYTVCEGYPDFLCEPEPPRVEVPRFFPFYPIVLNEVENDEELFTLSDVDLIEHQQREMNRGGEALRQHRIAAAPYTVTGKGKLSEDDKNRLKNRVPHEVIELQALVGQQKVTDLFQAGPTAPIDQNLYSEARPMADILRAGGAQEANLGPSSGNTATEAGIAESSRSQTVSSNIDDIDTTFSHLARDSTLVMFKNVSLGTAQKIAGKGALWPEISSDDISGELYLDIVAGSSGKPNREREAAAFERIVPLAIQIPGINPQFMAKKAVELMDDAVDVEDAILDGLPSIMSMNALLKSTAAGPGAPTPSTGDPRSDPAQQGENGADNDEAGPGVPGGPQAGNPAPDAAMTGQFGSAVQ